MVENIKKYKMFAILGIMLMGIGSFVSCLSTVDLYRNIGTGVPLTLRPERKFLLGVTYPIIIFLQD